jgi:hypothetical protein
MEYIKYIIAVCIVIIIIIIAIYTSNVIAIPFGICIFGLLSIGLYYNITDNRVSKYTPGGEKYGRSEKSIQPYMKTLLDNWYELRYLLFYQSYPHVTSRAYRLLATLRYHHIETTSQYTYLGNEWIFKELSNPPIMNKIQSIDQLDLAITKYSKKYNKSNAFIYQEIMNIRESRSFIYTINANNHKISSVLSSNKSIPDKVIDLFKYISAIIDTCVYVPSAHRDIIKQYKICIIRLNRDNDIKNTLIENDYADMYNEYLIADWIPLTIPSTQMEFNIPISAIDTLNNGITYVFDIPHLDQRDFLKYTIKNKWRRIDINIVSKLDYIVDLYLYSNDRSRYGTIIHKMPARVKSHLLNIEDLGNKVTLHKLIMENPKIRKYIPESIIILHQKTDPNNKNIEVIPTPTEPWIWRPAFSASGWGIEVVTSKVELDAVIDKYEYLDKKYMFVLSRYITNPKLIENIYNGQLYKFHIRLNVVVSIDKYNTKRFFIINTAEMFLASNPYTNHDYNNKKIHDTHSKTNKFESLFPDNFPGTEAEKNKLIIDIKNMLKDIFNTNITYSLKKADKCESGFHIFGIDIMITDENKPILIEINRYPGLPAYVDLHYQKCVTRISKEFYSGLWDMVINPLVTGAPIAENHKYMTLITTVNN